MVQIKPLKGFEQLYTINEQGEIFSIRKNRICSGHVDKRGYQIITLRKENKRYQEKVHRLVANTFIENPKGKTQVNHINGVRHDNRVENLEWVTPKENILHAHKLGLATNLHRCIKINQIEPITQKIIATYNSCREASKITGIHEGCIARVVRGERKLAGNYHWKTCND